VVLPYTSFASQSSVLLQAYSYGKPVVVTNVGGLAEAVFEDQTGEVSQVSSKALAESIIAMLSDPKRLERAAENARDAIKGKYSWNIVARETLRVYETLTAKKD
jgi:glycosyltransferase involved in cell wall biosynthesis